MYTGFEFFLKICATSFVKWYIDLNESRARFNLLLHMYRRKHGYIRKKLLWVSGKLYRSVASNNIMN